MDNFPVLLAAWLLGILGSGHCLAMCGGIVSALSFSQASGSAPRRHSLVLSYNLGRIASYTLMGALVGGFAASLPASQWPLARTFAALLLLAMGLYVAGWWRGLQWLERAGQWLWRFIKPLGGALLPLNSPVKGFLLGMVWGWLPCGLVYSALAYAGAQGTGPQAAAVMLAFGLGTLPALWLGGALASQLKAYFAKPKVRSFAAVGFLLFGLWTLLGAWWHPLMHGDHQPASEHRDAIHGEMPHHHHHH